MDGFYHRQTQFELFPSAVGREEGQQRPRIFNSPLTMSMENLIVLMVVIVMSMVLSFSYGVERGKKANGVSSPGTLVKGEGEAVRKAPARVVKSDPLTIKGKSAVEKSAPAVAMSAAQTAAEGSESRVPVQAAAKAPEKIVDKFYTVQVASYKKGDYAAKAAEGLKQKGYETLVVTKGEHDIVCVGKFAAAEEAKKFSRKLKKQYKDCLVRRM